jgi:thiol-disulfide isomerase/thioredoxin
VACLFWNRILNDGSTWISYFYLDATMMKQNLIAARPLMYFVALTFSLTLLGVPARAEDKVDLQLVKLNALQSAIAKHKGKIVVVDFWATFCIPCKAEFPNLVKIHNEQGKDVVCISVTVDDADDKAAALKFLTDKKATFENFLLDEPAELYQKKLEFTSVPTVLVYDKDGKLAKKFNGDKPDNVFTYKDVRKLVDELLKK